MMRWVLYQESFPDSFRMGAYYAGYVPMMVLPGSTEEIKTKYGFSIFGSSKDSTLVKCFRLVNDYEPSLVQFISSHLCQGKILVDVGANEGYFTLLGASKGAHVYAVEPSKNNLKFLTDNIERNNYSQRVTILPYAAGDEDKIVTFHESSLNGMWSSVGQGKTNLLSTTTQVKMKCLQEIIPNLPDIIKIDVEGFEDAVLAGAKKWLKAKKTTWIIETDDTTPAGESVIRSFQDLGYRSSTLAVDSACLPGKIYYPEIYTGDKVGFRNFIFEP